MVVEMTCAHPERPVKASGVCGACYDRVWRSDRSKRVVVNGRSFNPSGLPFQIYDMLSMDGGWLTTEGIQLMFPNHRPEHVDRSLWRLAEAGAVEHRTVPLLGLERRAEWRTL